MNEQDCRAVENMALTGMELEGLYACFPKFPSLVHYSVHYSDTFLSANKDLEVKNRKNVLLLYAQWLLIVAGHTKPASQFFADIRKDYNV